MPRGDPGRNGAMVEGAFAEADWEPRPLLRLWPEGPAEEAAAAYAGLLEEAFGPGPEGLPGRPRFDLGLLGVGADGHTASLFPGDPILAESRRLAAPSLAPAAPRRRMSLSFPALEGTRRLLYLLRGAEKAPIARVLEEGRAELPALRLAGLVEEAGGEARVLYCEAE